MIDEEWTRWSERSFSWLGHRLIQTIVAHSPVPVGELTVSNVTATTVVVDNITAPESEVTAFLANHNECAIGTALVYVPEYHHIASISGSPIHDHAGDLRSTELGAFAILQLCECESAA